MKYHPKYNKDLFLSFMAFLALAFSFFLMSQTFGYENGELKIASKVWSDFASHIPLIRSFSLGENLPPQYPTFPGTPIKYHFMFYFLVGVLENLGLRIDYALNILSGLGFFGLLIIIYHFAKLLFNSSKVALLSVIFFLFNGTLSFIYFFQKHSIDINILDQIIKNKDFASFAPYGPGLVSAFWSLNIYTNQRHLAAAFALSLLILYVLLIPVFHHKKPGLLFSVLLGLILGQSYFFHLPILVMTLLVLSILFLFFKSLRLPILVIGCISILFAIPQYLYTRSADPGLVPLFKPGYLIADNLSFNNFVNYWWLNFGLHLVLAPIGFALAPKNAKKVLLAFLPLLIIANLFQFSPEIAANHKFINFFIIVAGMFSAYAIIYIWNKKGYFQSLAVILTFFLTLSGFIDLFPVISDFKYGIADSPKNPDISWIIKNTPPTSVFLNTNYFYESSSLAGRKIFNGWGYFSWSAGYDSFKRDEIHKQLLASQDLISFCNLSNGNNLSYLSINPNDIYPDLKVNTNFFSTNFSKVYQGVQSNLEIYQLKPPC